MSLMDRFDEVRNRMVRPLPPAPGTMPAPGGMPGAPNAAPLRPPAPPSPATAPQGRPTGPAARPLPPPAGAPAPAPRAAVDKGRAAMARGAQAQPAGAAPMRTLPASPMQAQSALPPSPAGGVSTDLQAAQAGMVPEEGVAPEEAARGFEKPVQAYSTMPNRTTIASMLPGSEAETPMGRISTGGDGKARITLNEQGQAQYRAAAARARKRYGATPFDTITGAPKPPIRPGKPNYNPFTGWS